MPYYNAGDYYGRGDYYQAGGLFSLLGKAAKFIGGVARKAISLAPGIGPVIGTALELRERLRQHGVSLPTGGPLPGITAGAEQALTGVGVMAPGGGAGPPMIAPPAPGGMMDYGGHAMVPYGGGRFRATHPNKSTYVTRGGGTSRWPQTLTVHEKGTELVHGRRMNVANPRALRRALRRAAGFVKLARRAHVKLSHYHGQGGKKKKK